MFSLEAQHCKESRDALVDNEAIKDLKKIRFHDARHSYLKLFGRTHIIILTEIRE